MFIYCELLWLGHKIYTRRDLSCYNIIIIYNIYSEIHSIGIDIIASENYNFHGIIYI